MNQWAPWIPFFQSLLWLLLGVAIILAFRNPVCSLLQIVSRRISEGSGADVSVGPIKMALTQGQGGTPSAPMASASPAVASVTHTAVDYPQRLYLVHAFRRDNSASQGGNQYYRLRIYLDGDTEQDLSNVAKVIYHLHPTFQEPIQERSDAAKNFQVMTRVWGEFNVWAEVYIKDKTEPVVLERFVNLSQQF